MEKIHASKLLAGLVPAGFLTSDPEVELVTIHKGIRKVHRLHQKSHGDVTTGLFQKSCHQATIDCV